jgi:hypothetical protein
MDETKDELWWKCTRGGCSDRAVVFPVGMLPCKCGVCGGNGPPVLCVVMAVPLCGPCSTIVTAADLMSDRVIGFVQGATATNAHGHPMPDKGDFKLEMRMLEHFVAPNPNVHLPEKTWRPNKRTRPK